MSSIFSQKFCHIDDDHKELSLSKETNFKVEAQILDTWISQYKSKWHEISCTYAMFYDL
jgi:hypothetical protein